MRDSGYIALISTIIISVLVISITTIVSYTGFFGMANILKSEYKDMSRTLAEACVETSLLKLALSKDYAGNETVSIDNDSCTILAIESSSGQKIIKTRANLQGAFTNLKVTVNDTDLSLIHWEELPNF